MPTAQAEELTSPPRGDAWSNTRLVKECLNGHEAAWAALIEKYKKLIFSIPIKYGLSQDDAADIFQAVCLEMLSELPKLRKPEALPKWIMQVTAHKCFHRKRESQRLAPEEENESAAPSTPAIAERVLAEAEEDQRLRDAISALPPRCQQLVAMLFFEEPARPYEEIAKTLGMATGSIGFTRQRCLERLRKCLVEADLP
jgi:RNA polymerase sigma factor (sigma-70 family)